MFQITVNINPSDSDHCVGCEFFEEEESHYYCGIFGRELRYDEFGNNDINILRCYPCKAKEEESKGG